MIRNCAKCNVQIAESFGFVCAGDFIKRLEDGKTKVREWCQTCTEIYGFDLLKEDGNSNGN